MPSAISHYALKLRGRTGARVSARWVKTASNCCASRGFSISSATVYTHVEAIMVEARPSPAERLRKPSHHTAPYIIF